jgi:hypothetical protein
MSSIHVTVYTALGAKALTEIAKDLKFTDLVVNSEGSGFYSFLSNRGSYQAAHFPGGISCAGSDEPFDVNIVDCKGYDNKTKRVEIYEEQLNEDFSTCKKMMGEVDVPASAVVFEGFSAKNFVGNVNLPELRPRYKSTNPLIVLLNEVGNGVVVAKQGKDKQIVKLGDYIETLKS